MDTKVKETKAGKDGDGKPRLSSNDLLSENSREKERLLQLYMEGDLCAREMPDLINAFIEDSIPDRRRLQLKFLIVGIAGGFAMAALLIALVG